MSDNPNSPASQQSEATPAGKTHPLSQPSKATTGEPGSTSVQAMHQSDLPSYEPTTDVDKRKADALANQKGSTEAGKLNSVSAEGRDGAEPTPASDRDVAEGHDGAEPTAVLNRDDAEHRQRAAEPDTAQQPAVAADPESENAGLAMAAPAAAERDRAAEREARQRALGIKSRSDEPAAVATPVKAKRTTDRWHGSLAFLILRLVAAAILGVRAWQHLTHMTTTQAYFQHSVLPKPTYFAWGVGIAEAVAAVLLFLGLATRLAGLLVAVIEIGMLAFFVWGKVNPFASDRIGFNGEFELLLAAVGLAFLLLGSGGLGLDAAFRRRSAKRKEDRELGNYA